MVPMKEVNNELTPCTPSPLQERASTNETRGYRFGRDECVTSSPAFSFSASRFVS